MIVSYAPVIHARTQYVDFRYDLVAAPEGFTPEDTNWARTLILNSTRFMDQCDSSGRRVVFGNGSVCVTGLTIRVKDLYLRCGIEPRYYKVDENEGREAYVFIGMAVRVDPSAQAFDVPERTLLDVYEKYVVPRWHETIGDEHCFRQTSVPYAQIDVPAAGTPLSLDTYTPARGGKVVLSTADNERDQVAAGVLASALQGQKIAFCSDMPNATSVLESQFDLVTTPNAESILREIARRTGDAQDGGSEGSGKTTPGVNPRAQTYEERIRRLSPPGDRTGHGASGVNEPHGLTAGDIGLGVAGIAGVAFTVIGLVSSANPILLATVGALTVVFVGVEAKRILDQINETR
ncbi:MAG: hypothetical protein FWD64_05360 [Acidobacteriaceae bacterium]|nr:hypothetical protein [Acidobacteriaceae bacterium]